MPPKIASNLDLPLLLDGGASQYDTYIYIYTPGTQMTLILVEKALFWGIDLQK